MFGMENLNTDKESLEKKAEKENLLKAFVEKEAKDHYHVDSEGKDTSPSMHEGGEKENPHKHKLKGGGETDKKPSKVQHTHKEKDEDGGTTGPAIKTTSPESPSLDKNASNAEQLSFIEGFSKEALFNFGDREVKVKMNDGKVKTMSAKDLARKAYKASQGKDYK